MSSLLLPIAPGSPFARAIGFRPVENALKRPVNVISLSLVWLDRDVELDLRPSSRCGGAFRGKANWIREIIYLSGNACTKPFLSFGNQAASGKVSSFD
jgi:hypothetical protein